MLRELLEDFRQQLKKRVTIPLEDHEDIVNNLIERTGAFWSVYRENWAIASAAFQLSMIDDEFAEAWRLVRRQGIRALSTVIKEAQRQGRCSGMGAELVASSLCAMLEYTCYNWTANRGDFPNRNIDDAVATAVLTQIVCQAVLWRDSLLPTAGPESTAPATSSTDPSPSKVKRVAGSRAR